MASSIKYLQDAKLKLLLMLQQQLTCTKKSASGKTQQH